MRKRGTKSGPRLSGFDYIIGAADTAEEQDRAFAWEFKSMASAAALGDTLGILGHIANRPLKDHEAAAAGVIVSAYAMAASNGDVDGAGEVVLTGVALLAKWNAYLTTMERPDGAAEIS